MQVEAGAAELVVVLVLDALDEVVDTDTVDVERVVEELDARVVVLDATDEEELLPVDPADGLCQQVSCEHILFARATVNGTT